jgi:hypothetical protein
MPIAKIKDVMAPTKKFTGKIQGSKYCDRMTEEAAVAKQWLGKHITIPNPLEGNGPINTFPRTSKAAMEEPLDTVSYSNTNLLLGSR